VIFKNVQILKVTTNETSALQVWFTILCPRNCVTIWDWESGLLSKTNVFLYFSEAKKLCKNLKAAPSPLELRHYK